MKLWNNIAGGTSQPITEQEKAKIAEQKKQQAKAAEREAQEKAMRKHPLLCRGYQEGFEQGKLHGFVDGQTSAIHKLEELFANKREPTQQQSR